MATNLPLRTHGFTLLEVLFVLGLASLLAGLAVPGLAALRRSATVSATANQLLAALYFAQSSAARANMPAALCLSTDLVHCATAAGRATGWLVFLDADRHSPVQISADDVRLGLGQLPAGVSIDGTRPAVTFWPTARAGTTATFSVCDLHDQTRGRAVIVSQSGRPRITQSAAGVCAG